MFMLLLHTLQPCRYAVIQLWLRVASGGGSRGLVLSYPLHHVFIIAEANGKEASISSDVEDGRFVAQMGLGWWWNCTLRCSRGCWDEQMVSHLEFKLRRQDTGKDLDKNLTFKPNKYTVTGFSHDAGKNMRLLLLPVALLCSIPTSSSALVSLQLGLWVLAEQPYLHIP